MWPRLWIQSLAPLSLSHPARGVQGDANAPWWPVAGAGQGSPEPMALLSVWPQLLLATAQ